MNVGAFVLVVSLLPVSPSSAVQEFTGSTEPLRTRVRISADDELRPQLTDCLERDLRLGGRRVVQESESADETLTVIALRVVLRSRGDIGVAYSVTATRPASKALDAVAQHVAPEHQPALAKAAAVLVQPIAHWLETGDRRDVGVVCRSIARSYLEASVKAQAVVGR